MLQLRVLDILQERRLTKYWLYKRMNAASGISYQNFNNIVMNKTSSIKFDNLERMCRILECNPGDLFVLCDSEGKENTDRQ